MLRLRITSAALVTAATVSLLAACGGSDSTSSGADCDRAAIAEALAAQGGVDASAKLDDGAFGCAGGWAYAFADVGEGEEEVTVTFVLQSSDGVWSVRDRSEVCNAPGDEVPDAIYKDACETN